MANTEADVRNAVIAGIEGIWDTLGYVASPGNVKAYLLEQERLGKHGEYLLAEINSESQPMIRAWAVQVLAREEFTALKANSDTPTRFYEITVRGYYGAHGSTPVNLLIDHARAVRKAIYDLTSRISNTVGATTDVSMLELDRFDTEETPEEVFTGTMVYAAEYYNPGWT